MSAQRLALCVRDQPGRMLAWRVHSYSGVADLRLEAVRRPVLRAPDELLVKVKASALNPIDVAMLDGYGHCALGAWRRAEGLAQGVGGGEGGGGGGRTDASDALPLTVGREFTGEVVRAGPRARYSPGDLVWGVVPPHRTGAHAQYVAVDHDWICPLPSGMEAVPSGGGGALYCGLTALSALRAAGLEAGAGRAGGVRVLVLGCGGVGQAALQLLRGGGAHVTAACSRSAAHVARSLGAAHVLEREEPDYDRMLEDRAVKENIVRKPARLDCLDVYYSIAAILFPTCHAEYHLLRKVGVHISDFSDYPFGDIKSYDVILDTAGLGGAEAGARGWHFSRYVTLSSPALRETDARGLCAGAAAAAAALVAQNLSVARMSRTSPAAPAAPATDPAPAPRTLPALPPQVRWAFFTPSMAGLRLLTHLANRGEFKVVVEEIYPWWRAAEAYERMSRGHLRGKLILDYTATQPDRDEGHPTTGTAQTARHDTGT